MRSILAAIGRALKGMLKGGTSMFSWAWDHTVVPVANATNYFIDGIDHVAGSAIKGTLSAAASILAAPFRAAPTPQQASDGTADNAARNEVAKLEATKVAKAPVDQITEIRRVAMRLYRGQSIDQARLSDEVRDALKGLSKPGLKQISEASASKVASFIAAVVKVEAAPAKTEAAAEEQTVIRLADKIAERLQNRARDASNLADVEAVRRMGEAG